MGRDDDRFDDRHNRGGQKQGREWSDADDYYGNRGSRGEDEREEHGRPRPGHQGQESFGGGGTGGQSGWGQGQGPSQYGNTRGDMYGGGGARSGRYYGQGSAEVNQSRGPGNQGGSGNQGFGGQTGQGWSYGQWGGNESMGHGEWGSGNQQGGGYRGQNYSGDSDHSADRSGFSSSTYGGGQFQQGGVQPGSTPGYSGSGGSGYGSSNPGGGQHAYGSIMQGQQSYAGRGPKGWKRSDERIREDLSEQLERHPRIDASDIEVGVENGEVTLTGTVSDRQSKRLAEDIAENVQGVSDVQNQIRVKRPQGSGGLFTGLFGGTADGDTTTDRTSTPTAQRNMGESQQNRGRKAPKSSSA